MTNRLYPAGFPFWFGDAWSTLDLGWLLLDSLSGFSPYADTVADLVPNEISVAGYTRLTVTDAQHGARDADNMMQTWDYGGPAPEWTGLAAGQQVGGLVLFTAGADDATSTPLAHWELVPGIATDVGELVFTLPDALAWHIAWPSGTRIFHTYWVQ